KLHTVHGRNAILRAEQALGDVKSTFLSLAKEIAFTHHEKWDGSGYPQSLAGDEIPISGRLMALADVYDALTSKRVYKEAFFHEKATEIIRAERGNHFDPEIVDAFLDIEDVFRNIAQNIIDPILEPLP
ncbi:MAG: HD domain-containing protein, partial [Chloroflexi bacterium]